MRIADIVINKIKPDRRYRDDCHQAALLAGWQALSRKHRDKATSRGYLYLCMAQAAWRCWRREQRHEANVELVIEIPVEDAPPNETLLDDPRLTDDERQLLKMHYVEGLTIRQIGSRSRTPKSTVHYRLRQAVRRLV
ncbi:MAG TPA: sigma-70 family RNA polymerase sigma factor [Tepidisphaeraceae bacterium]|jgi:DNA-directed RNA polymerase specialized sigma24 family protein|nr:sigma-70 family RNA polymerase sigma factor [Tepidisphaeraceae bacterium]